MRRHLLAILLLGVASRSAHADGGVLGGDTSRPHRGGDAPGASAPPAAEGNVEEDGFKLRFHGFLRIPFRVGVGGAENLSAASSAAGSRLHSPPQIPDGSYTEWRYTNIMGGPWTELWFSYGNGKVTANVVLAAYDVSDASYRDLQSQLGINQSFVTLNLPTLFGDKGGLVWNVGAFAKRYGTAEKYDAGKYDTYLFGATHVAGETVSAFYDVGPRLTVLAEHGLGAKLQVTPLVPGATEAPYLPYPGDVQQGATLLHHAHTGITWDDQLTLALHYLTAWTADARLLDEQDGRVTNVGADLKLTDSRFGDGYLGYSHLMSENPLRVAGAFEVLHSFEGWNLRDNYFGEAASGTGTVDTLLFQYTFSMAKYLWAPQEFYGQASDLRLSVFGMYNHVGSDDPAFTAATDKLKFGAEITYSPRSWLGLDLRYDVVQPDLADNRQSFHVISPMIVLRTEFASHEEIVLGYSRYVNGSDVKPGYPHEALAPDRDVFKIAAVMWW